MVKASIPLSISEETDRRRFLQKTDLKWTNFRGKESCPKITEIKLKFVRNICRKGGMCNHKISKDQNAYGTRESKS